MPGLMDFDERKQVRGRKRSSLSTYLGGIEAAEAERAYQELQAAFARPLGLPRRRGGNEAGGQRGCSCHGATCGCHKGASPSQLRHTRHSVGRSKSNPRADAHGGYGSGRVGGLLGHPASNRGLQDAHVPGYNYYPHNSWTSHRPVMPPMLPVSGDADCAREWQEAREYCRWLIPLGPNGPNGGYRDIENCARGLVSAGCGGNPIDYGRFGRR
jgi:hypothetical protein